VKVLFIDDDALTTEWVALFLESKQIEVRTADSVPAATRCLADWLPDVIISDLNIKGDRNSKITDFLIRNGQQLKVPVIAVSGYELDSQEREKFHAYLSKPVEPQTLLKLIKDVESKADKN